MNILEILQLPRPTRARIQRKDNLPIAVYNLREPETTNQTVVGYLIVQASDFLPSERDVGGVVHFTGWFPYPPPFRASYLARVALMPSALLHDDYELVIDVNDVRGHGKENG